jgi:hypothetical protein
MSQEKNLDSKHGADNDPEREERERSFTRRGLMQWTVPALLIAANAATARQVLANIMPIHNDNYIDYSDYSNHSDNHYDFTPSPSQPHGDHNDGTTHDDYNSHGDHTDANCPIHQDSYTDTCSPAN